MPQHEGDRPLYFNSNSNTVYWCFGTEDTSYHCTVSMVLGTPINPDMAMRFWTAVILLTVSLPSFAALQASNPRSITCFTSGCHLVNGTGNHPNVPTLHDELGRMLSVPAMRAYLVQIPGAAQAPIDDLALADVINWVLRQWNSETLPVDFEELTLEEVSAASVKSWPIR